MKKTASKVLFLFPLLFVFSSCLPFRLINKTSDSESHEERTNIEVSSTDLKIYANSLEQVEYLVDTLNVKTTYSCHLYVEGSGFEGKGMVDPHFAYNSDEFELIVPKQNSYRLEAYGASYHFYLNTTRTAGTFELAISIDDYNETHYVHVDDLKIQHSILINERKHLDLSIPFQPLIAKNEEELSSFIEAYPELGGYSFYCDYDVYNIIICELYTFRDDGMPEFANAFVSEQTVFLNYSIKYNDNTDLIDMRAYYLLQFIRIAKTDCLDNITINWSYYAE